MKIGLTVFLIVFMIGGAVFLNTRKKAKQKKTQIENAEDEKWHRKRE